MNVKITKSLHEELCKLDFEEYLFGSQLHGIANENSDCDYLRVISDSFYNRFKTFAKYLPNIHSFQYTESSEKQYLWMTESQFWRGLFSGDGNLIADIVLFSGRFESPLELCYSYKIIKGYLGVAKRDIKLHTDWKKKIFHSLRSIYMSEMLMKKRLPKVSDVVQLYKDNINNLPDVALLRKKEAELRNKLNEMLNNGEIMLYPIFNEEDELANIINKSNNIKEFKYENNSNGGL